MKGDLLCNVDEISIAGRIASCDLFTLVVNNLE